MIQKKGIDVSVYQGDIDWAKVKPQIDFAILRAGYGCNNVDAKFHRNASECTRLGIPFGVYWFSYAYTVEMAKAEADYVCNLVSQYELSYPICFDFEYDSTAYAKNNGVNVTKKLMLELATAFLSRVEKRGYYAMNYANLDYLGRGFSELQSRYDTWFASWNVSAPRRSCGIWQYSSTGRVNGINGNVDMDYSYKDYPSIIGKMKENTSDNNENLSDNSETNVTPSGNKLENFNVKICSQYKKIAEEIIEGKWGNGSERKKKLQEAGYDYNFAQGIVNILMG